MDLEKVPPHTRAGLLAMNTNAALANVEPEDILDAFEQGVSIPKQAQALGITHQAIYKHLLAKAPEKWKQYQAAHALAKLDDCEQKLTDAVDGVAVSRERELARLQCWKLERVVRNIYGQDSPTVQVNINLGNVGERIADLERELLSQRTYEAKSSPTITNSTQAVDHE